MSRERGKAITRPSLPIPVLMVSLNAGLAPNTPAPNFSQKSKGLSQKARNKPLSSKKKSKE